MAPSSLASCYPIKLIAQAETLSIWEFDDLTVKHFHVVSDQEYDLFAKKQILKSSAFYYDNLGYKVLAKLPKNDLFTQQ